MSAHKKVYKIIGIRYRKNSPRKLIVVSKKKVNIFFFLFINDKFYVTNMLSLLLVLRVVKPDHVLDNATFFSCVINIIRIRTNNNQ